MYFTFYCFDSHRKNGCKKDRCICSCLLQKEKEKIKKDAAPYCIYYFCLQFQPTGSPWIFFQRTASRAIAACHPWSQWRIWLWLIRPPEWSNYTSEVGKLSLTGDVQVTYTFFSEIEYFVPWYIFLVIPCVVVRSTCSLFHRAYGNLLASKIFFHVFFFWSGCYLKFNLCQELLICLLWSVSTIKPCCLIVLSLLSGVLVVPCKSLSSSIWSVLQGY